MYYEEDIRKLKFESSVKLITELINRRAQTLESLHRHLTTLSSTLLGILAVFGGSGSRSLLSQLGIFLGSTSLFLCLLSGIYCMWQYYRVLDKSAKLQAKNLQEYGRGRFESVVFPKTYGFAAIFCPAIFCLGVLFLLVAVVSRLELFHLSQS